LDPEASRFVVQELRDQLGSRVYPVHRLDRKTSGALLLALDKNTQSELNNIFRERVIEKSYLAIVRGHTPKALEIDYALKTERGNFQEAQTTLKTIAHTEKPISSGKYNSSRYSLVELRPLTGRQHQLRKHMAHIMHPIIGDRPHGCNKQNKFFLEHFEMNSMLLHAYSTTGIDG
jgi:tRNA pseudouridine65 synthase